MARLPRPVITRMSVMPAATASSITYWIDGLSTTGSISLGMLFEAGRNRVPSPAAGMTALLTGLSLTTRSFRPRATVLAGIIGTPTRPVDGTARDLPVGGERPIQSMLLAPYEAPQVRRVAQDHDDGHRADHRDVERAPSGQPHEQRERDRDHERRDGGSLENAGDHEPDDAEPDDDEREHHDEDATSGRDALAALEPARRGQHVAEHRRNTEHIRAAVAVEREADAGRQRALREVGDHDEQAGLPAHEPGHVRGARVARPFPQHVVAAGPRHDRRARERAEQVRHGYQQQCRDHVLIPSPGGPAVNVCLDRGSPGESPGVV